MGVNENRQSGLDEAVQIGSTAAKVVEGAAKAGKITVAAANGTALGGPYGAAASAANIICCFLNCNEPPSRSIKLPSGYHY